MSQVKIPNLANHPEYFDQTIELIEKSFNYPQNESFKTDFFPLMEKGNSHHNFLAMEKGELQGHVGVKLREMGNDKISFKVALLGGVAVNPKFRRKGVLTGLLDKIFLKFEDQVGLFILWSNEVELYKKFNFFLAGSLVESHGENNSDFYGRYTKTKFKSLESGDLLQIKNIYQQYSLKNFFSFLRSDEDWESLKKIDSSDLYILRESTGKILGYFCQNKGGDLNGIVHEFGFLNENQNEVLKLFSALKIWFPSVSNTQMPGKNIYQALFRIGSVKIFNKFLIERSQGRLSIVKWNKEDVLILFEGKKFNIPLESFFQFIFGPFPPDQFKDISCQLFFSGLDSV